MKKLSLFTLNSQTNLIYLNHSWNFYLYLLKYSIIAYFEYDGMQTALISLLKCQMKKNNNKLIVVNNYQINKLFNRCINTQFDFLKKGRHLILLCNDWSDLIKTLTENLINYYNLITISFKGNFINLLWDISINTSAVLINLYNKYYNKNCLILYSTIYYVLLTVLKNLTTDLNLLIISIQKIKNKTNTSVIN